MTVRVGYDAPTDCVISSVTGELDKEVVLELLSEVGRVAVENQCERVLSDLREAKVVATTADIYQMAKLLGSNQISKALKRAVVVSRDEEDYAFWETVCFNQGYQNVKIFRDYDEAKRWVATS